MLLRRSDLHSKNFAHSNCLNDILFFRILNNNYGGLDSKILTLTFLRRKCDEKLYRLNLALILIGEFMWAGQIKSYNGNTIVSIFV
jgi:hypothetical protein